MEVRPTISSSAAWLHRHLKANDLVPVLHALRTFPAICFCLEAVSTWTEVLAALAESGEETLGMTSRFEAAHRSFPLAWWLVRMLGAIVEASVSAMLDAGHDFLLGCLVAAERVRDQHARNIAAAFEQFAEDLCPKGARCCLVPSALHQDIQEVPVLIDGAPQVV